MPNEEPEDLSTHGLVEEELPTQQSVNAEWILGIRPKCGCCGGGEYRKGYKNNKSKSFSKNMKNKRAKPRHKDKRD